MEAQVVIARSAATMQSKGRRAPYVPLDFFAALAMTSATSVALASAEAA